jgi:hypothetical protein
MSKHPSLDDPSDHYNADEKEWERIDPAWAKAALCFRTESAWRFGHKGELRCFPIVSVHAELEVYRKRYEAGGKINLLRAIAYCSEENMPLPTWLALAFREHMKIYDGLDTGAFTLDEVFVNPKLKTNSTKEIARSKQEWKLGGEMWFMANDIAQAEPDTTSFDAVVKKVLKRKNWGVGLTTAKRLIEEHDKNQYELLGKPSQSLSGFLSKRRKP